jgi:hypothetical protein
VLPARPTLRTLREDLKIPVPPVSEPLNEIGHPLLAKAREQFADENAAHERIRAIDDQVLFKVKARRWRGAVWIEELLPWVVAAGRREDGSQDDFYQALENQAVRARADYNRAHSPALPGSTYVAGFLPGQDDRQRYRLEAGARFRAALVAIVRNLTAGSLRDGREHAADFDGFRIGLLVRADDGHETYAAVRITGSVPGDLIAVILRNVPGCDPKSWWPETALPARPLMPAEQAWSTLMDSKAAAELLEQMDAPHGTM